MYRITHTESGQTGRVVSSTDSPFEAKELFTSMVRSKLGGAIALSFNNKILYRHRFDAVEGEMDNCEGIDINPFT